jgi:hypothetical protein
MERTLAALSLSFEELAERVSPAVVQIIARAWRRHRGRIARQT